MKENFLNQKRLIAIGGNEDRSGNLIVLKRVIQELKKTKCKIVIITTASKESEKLEKEYYRVFTSLNAYKIEIFNIKTRSQANDMSIINKLKDVDLIFFTGGNQLRLTSIIGGSKILQVIKNLLKSGCVVAGTSAGTAVLSDIMIYEGESEEGLFKGKVFLTAGFGFIKNIVFDTHFVNRGRIGRLIQIVVTNPSCIGIGISEDCGVIIHGSSTFEVFGTGHVLIVDGRNIGFSNITRIKPGEAITVENICIHSLSNGYKYDFKHKKIIKS